MSQLIATVHGWVDPKNGKLVESIRGLSDAQDWNPNTDKLEDLQGATKKEESAPVEKVEEVKKEPKAPKKNTKGKNQKD